MVAIIGYPGEQMHTWKRFRVSESSRRMAWRLAWKWADATVAAISDRHPARATAARTSARVISEKEAARARYRDGRRVYPKGVEAEYHAEQVS